MFALTLLRTYMYEADSSEGLLCCTFEFLAIYGGRCKSSKSSSECRGIKKNMDVLTEGECVAFVMILSTLCSEGSVRNVCVASPRPNQIFFFFFF